jgi:putative nucleotidyltransferase with HDIG domain
MLEPERKQLDALAMHLRRREGVLVRVYDANGRLALDSSDGAQGCTPEDDDCRSFLRESCRTCAEKGTSACLRCPRGRDVQVRPITRSSVYFGSLVACGADEGAGSGDQTTGAVLDAMLEIIAEESSKEHEIDSLATELALRYEEIELLYEIDEQIPLRSYTSRVVEFVAGKAFEAINSSCLAWVASGPGGSLLNSECRLLWNEVQAAAPSTMLRLEAEQLARAVVERSLKSGEAEVVTNIDRDPELSAFASELNSVLCLPLRVEDDFYGCLVAFKPRGDQFTSYELKLMTALARKSAFVIRDSRLYEDLDSLFFNLIKLLVNTIENKDEYTKGHSQRVRTFTLQLARHMGLPPADLETLNLSGLLHDIGKQGIPDAVLKKEGKLTEEERAMINTHPARGVNLIKHIKQFEKCLPHIRHHHERIDGNGYPDGLKGDRIPLGARIIAVADTFDALTSDRCYRPRFGTDRALEIIEDVAGSQLDADVARLLLEHREQFVGNSQAVLADPLTAGATRAGKQGRTP